MRLSRIRPRKLGVVSPRTFLIAGLLPIGMTKAGFDAGEKDISLSKAAMRSSRYAVMLRGAVALVAGFQARHGASASAQAEHEGDRASHWRKEEYLLVGSPVATEGGYRDLSSPTSGAR
jgi:hypothetical protein